eukprot:Rhum_TRINITY_DN14601_c7_g1::Rhum_TRINITY_DN14601_c7_g1_i1::g.104762::m.104762
MLQQDAPRVLCVVSPNMQGPGGVYTLARDLWADEPFWIQSDGEKVIYVGKKGRYYIGKIGMREKSAGWCYSRKTVKDGAPDDMDWVSKKAGWQVDPQLVCTAVPDADLDIDEGAVRLPPLPRCERCTRLERELADARGRADAAWARSLLDRDRVAEAESQLDWLRHAAGRSVGKESELAFLEDEREKLGALVEAHKSRADEAAAELTRLRNRELTRDDVGDGLRAGLLECTTAALDTARRQIARTRDLLAKVTTMAVSPRGVGGGGGGG